MTVGVQWKGGLSFDSEVPSGGKLAFDASPSSGGEGPTPMEVLLCAVAACSAMDVVSILEKKRQTVASYRVEVAGERPPEGVWPRPFTSIKVTHILSGEGLDPVAVARAVSLSDEKYCSVTATLRTTPEIVSEWKILD
jgi:putative redox protein